MRVMYESYVPSYAVSYDCLGDQEAFTLKYTWELAVYFGFYVVPMINNLFTDTAVHAVPHAQVRAAGADQQEPPDVPERVLPMEEG